MEQLIFATLVVLIASLLGGISGFGYSLVSTPLLLALGFPLGFVVSANLTLALITRIVVAYRLRVHLNRRRVGLLVAGSLPGVLIGTWLLSIVPAGRIKLAAGVLVLIAVVLIARSLRGPLLPPIPGASFVAGMLGGLLGATTSLNGIPPVLLLARDRVAPKSFQADLALYFVLGNIITLTLLGARGLLASEALFPPILLWLPIALLGNNLGVALSTRLPETLFRRITLAVAFSAGLMTLL